MTRTCAALLVVACGSPKADESGPRAPDTSQPVPWTDSGNASETGTDRDDSGPADTATGTDSGSDTADRCPEPPWQSMSLGETIDPVSGEGISIAEADAAAVLASDLLTDSGVAAVFWREVETDRYVLQTQSGEASFVRERDEESNLVLSWQTDLPLLDDPFADATLDVELSYGNPAETSYPDQGYALDDERLAFPETSEASHPRLAERVTQVFDSVNGPDLGVILAPYAAGGVGTHGGMSVAQSRAPLLMRGPGIVPGTHEMAADLVDIAPTVAGLLGVSPVTGTDGRRGRRVTGQMLGWQDGRVLEELLVESCAWGAAQRAVVLILDGLNHTEFVDGVATGRYPNLARLADGGAVASAGSTVGWPSFSLPGHVSVFTGAYQGHHGLLSNAYLDRSSGTSAPGIDLFDLLADPTGAQEAMDVYMSTEVETLYEAVGRTFSDAQTASINELTFRGTTWGRHASKSTSPVEPPGDYDRYRLADQTVLLQMEQMVDDIGLPKLLGVSMYLSDGVGEGEGPHGDQLREALIETDDRVGQILDIYTREGGFDDTLFVVTADHGMALQDSARSSAWTGHLPATATNFGYLIYLD